MIRIMKTDPTMDISLDDYRLPLSQMRFSGHPNYIINQKREGYVPFVIFNDNHLIGVFALDSGDILSKLNADKAVYLRGLSIASHHQGKGYFKKTLQVIEHYLNEHHPEIDKIYLMVNVKNDDAYYAFIKSGFKDNQKTMRQGLSTLKILSKSIS